MKKSILITLLFQLILLAQTGVKPTGSGTETDPYIVANWQNLYWISQNKNYENQNQWNKYFKQTEDIDLATAEPPVSQWNNGKGWTPIGYHTSSSNYRYFTGTYDGQGHTIANLFFNDATKYEVGLFGKISGATIKNIALSDVNITAAGTCGAIAGYSMQQSIISGCSSTGIVTGESSIGGLIGINGGSKLTTSNSSASITAHNYGGGLVGQNTQGSEISSSTASGTISVTSYGGGASGINDYQSKIINTSASGDVSGATIGGLTAINHNQSSISGCHSTGKVDFIPNETGMGSAGGFVGSCGNSTITDSYSTGNVSGDGGSGGFASSIGQSSVVERCYSTGNVIGNGKNNGGFAGSTSYAYIYNCFSRGSVTRKSGYTASENEWIGSFIGISDGIENKRCYSTGAVIYQGAVSPNNKGFIGHRTYHYITIFSANFFDFSTNGQTAIDSLQAYPGAATGLNTALMKSLYTYTGWDFVNVWDFSLEINDGYPHLRGYSSAIESVTKSKSSAITGNYPNPFNPSTTITYSLDKSADVEFNIYDIRGSVVYAGLQSKMSAGQHSFHFDAAKLSSGIYICVMKIDGIIAGNQKLNLIK